jgi:pimeloyl-ACP methyl ester carboxylesterase
MTGPPQSLVLLHGALGTRETLTPVADLLKNQYVVHVPDLPAHGALADDTSAFTIDGFIDFLDAYLSAHQLNQPAVFGYSLGGYIALAYALRHPGKLHSICTLATKYHWSPEIAEREIRMLDPDVIEAKVPQFASVLRLRHGDPRWKALLAGTATLMTQLGAQPVVTPGTVLDCTLPVTIALGTDDKMVSEAESRAIAEALPNAEFRLMPEVPHPIEKVEPGIVAGLIQNTLK